MIVLIPTDVLFHVLAVTYRKDLRPIFKSKYGSFRSILDHDHHVFHGTQSPMSDEFSRVQRLTC